MCLVAQPVPNGCTACSQQSAEHRSIGVKATFPAITWMQSQGCTKLLYAVFLLVLPNILSFAYAQLLCNIKIAVTLSNFTRRIREDL